MKKLSLFLVLPVLFFLLFGCTSEDLQGDIFPTDFPDLFSTQLNDTTNPSPSTNNTHGQPVQYVEYQNPKAYYTFTDPNEYAFSLQVPEDWVVTEGSGLIRPYIDAGIVFQAMSPSGQEFFYQSPYGYVYATPNQPLEYAGFTEGSLYDPSGGISQPMMVKSYQTAEEFGSELLSSLGITSSSITQRPDLATITSVMITEQSAAEFSVIMTDVIVARSGRCVMLLETGVWLVSLMEYHSPYYLVNETGSDILNMQDSFQVNQTWAAIEQQEILERLGILSQSQSDISEIISSSFEIRSESMDAINQEWDTYILGVEEVYDVQTGTYYQVNGGSNYYWIDNSGTIYGTATDTNPLPNEDLQLLDCPNC